MTSVVLAAVCAIWVYPVVWMPSACFKTNNGKPGIRVVYDA